MLKNKHVKSFEGLYSEKIRQTKDSLTNRRKITQKNFFEFSDGAAASFPHRSGVIRKEIESQRFGTSMRQKSSFRQRFATCQEISQTFLAPSSSRNSRMLGFSPQRGHFFWRAMGEE
jgi:hypothetical protein